MTMLPDLRIVCDRCALEERRHVERRWLTLRIGRLELDLCPACAAAFKAWFERPAQVKENVG